MFVRFFRVPVNGDQTKAEAEVNRFLGSHRILSVDRQFVPDGVNSTWAVCVTYIGKDPAADSSGKRSQVDYKEVLNEADFEIYAKLRNKRKELSAAQGVPAYALFTNEQLASLVRQRVDSIEALRRIDGVGEARANKHGAEFLAILREEIPRLGAKTQEKE